MTNWILTAIFKAVWLQFVSGPLYLISGFSNVLYYLSGGVVWDLLFGAKKDFSFNTIPMAFWGFCILASAIICIIFAVQYITLLFSDTKEIRSRIITATKMTGFACIFVFFIPIGYFLLNQLIIFLSGTLNQVFGIKSLNIAGMVWNIGNPDWNGKDIYSGNYFDTPANILHYNLIAEIFGTWFMGFAILMLGLALVQKIFEIFFLFIIGPVVAATMTNDNGKRMLIWKDYVIAKSLASLGTIIAYYTFMIGIGAILTSSLGGLGGAERQLLIILLICGGALSCLGISNIIAAFVGEGVGIREGLASISSTFAAAKMTMGAAKITGKAIGFGKNKKAQSTKGQGGNNSPMPGGMEYGTQQSNAYQQQNAGTTNVMDNEGFRFAHTGLRSRTGLAWAAGTALALGTSTVFAFSKGAKKSWTNSTGERSISGRIGKAVTAGTGSAIAHPFKAVGRGAKKAATNTGKAIKANTHGVYKAKEKHHNKNKAGDKMTTEI